MRGRILAVLMLGVIGTAVLLGVEAAHAEEWQQAYTIADPVRENGYGLATAGGRYSISLGDSCAESGIVPGQNVLMAPVPGFSGAAVIVPVDGGTECPIRFEQLVADVPCFTDADGICDWRAEAD